MGKYCIIDENLRWIKYMGLWLKNQNNMCNMNWQSAWAAGLELCIKNVLKRCVLCLTYGVRVCDSNLKFNYKFMGNPSMKPSEESSGNGKSPKGGLRPLPSSISIVRYHYELNLISEISTLNAMYLMYVIDMFNT